MFQYDCPGCGNKVKLAQQAAPGKNVRCPVCEASFAPRAETIALADEPAKQPAKAKAAARPATAARPTAKPATPAAAPKPIVAPARPLVVEDADDDDVTPYGVKQESEEEKRLAEKNKPTFTETQDKFKKSARGPAQALLVLPTNLLIAEGALTGALGVFTIIVGLWPLVFRDAPPSDEEIAEQLVMIFGGLVAFVWGALICLGASKMQALESYAWSLAGSVLGIFPLLAGIFAIIALRDPRVIAGFEEVEGAIDDDEDGDDDEDDDDDDDDD